MVLVCMLHVCMLHVCCMDYAGILFVMLVGEYPFDEQMTSHSRKKRYAFSFGEAGAKLSAESKELIAKLLVEDPKKRIDVEHAKQHPFVLMHFQEFSGLAPKKKRPREPVSAVSSAKR